MERHNLIAAKDSNDKLNQIYKKSSQVLEARAVQLDQMCDSLQSQQRESSDEIASLRLELASEAARNQQLTLDLAALKGQLGESHTKVQQQEAEIDNLSSNGIVLAQKLDSA